MGLIVLLWICSGVVILWVAGVIGLFILGFRKEMEYYSKRFGEK